MAVPSSSPGYSTSEPASCTCALWEGSRRWLKYLDRYSSCGRPGLHSGLLASDRHYSDAAGFWVVNQWIEGFTSSVSPLFFHFLKNDHLTSKWTIESTEDHMFTLRHTHSRNSHKKCIKTKGILKSSCKMHIMKKNLLRFQTNIFEFGFKQAEWNTLVLAWVTSEEEFYRLMFF